MVGYYSSATATFLLLSVCYGNEGVWELSGQGQGYGGTLNFYESTTQSVKSYILCLAHGRKHVRSADYTIFEYA